MRRPLSIIATIAVIFLIGCEAPRIRLFPSTADPLQEYTLQGKEQGKVLVIPLRGMISDAPKRQFIRTRPSMVQEFVSKLRKAEDDPEVKAVLIKIDSPGGSVIASDLIYNEIVAFKKRKQVKVVVAMMGVAASGGYYIALPADFILAHPTTVTGSVGVLFIRPDVSGLMEKIGVDVNVSKTGRNKDMGSPFRQATQEEKKITQDLIDQLADRFLDRIAEHRKLDPTKLKELSSARIYLANEALKLGMIAKVVVYRRTEYPDDNLYNTSTSRYEGRDLSIISLDLPGSLVPLQTGFYYLWQPGAWDE
jgi:protease-4